MITTTATIAHPPQLRLKPIMTDILGASYDLTVVYIGRQRALSLNHRYRGKTYVPNVLSFPLSDTCGEIYICPEVATKEAASFGLSPKGYLAYLLIHGALHLKGYDHGPKMDAAETHYKKKYRVT